MPKPHKNPKGATPKTATPKKPATTTASASTTVPDQKPGLNLSLWIQNHKTAFHRALYHMSHNRFATFITIMVIAVTLTLPAMFQVLVSNLEGEKNQVARHAGISIFLKNDLSQAEIDQLVGNLRDRTDIEKVEFISSAAALKEFETAVGVTSDSLLSNNPLPAVVYLTPRIATGESASTIEALKTNLQSLNGVDLVQVDIGWIEQLFAIVALIKNASILLAIFLMLTVLVITGNTIRLLAQHYYDEILVSKLLGATDAYVRRPFLYSGLLFGLSGAILACFFVMLGFFWLYPEIERVINAYHSTIDFTGLDFADISSLLGTGIVLGVGGAWLASNRIINEISL